MARIPAMKTTLFVIKLTLSFFLLGVFVTKFDLSSTFGTLGSAAGYQALVIGVLITLVQSYMGGMRLQFILKLYDSSISFLTGFRIWLIGAFFSQLMISFVGGDAMRVWSLSRLQIPLRVASGAILLDRVIGFIALIIFLILTLPSLLNIIESPLMRYNVILLAFVGFSAIVVFILLGALPQKLTENRFFGFLFNFISNSRYIKNSVKDSTIALTLSFLIHLLHGLTIYILFELYGVKVDLFWCTVLSAQIMLIAMLPISFSGWGVRESVMITGFGLLGVPAEKSLAVSITVGLALLIGSLPGSICFLFERKRDLSLVSQS